ncbi:redoxin domain-containing protein [Spirosoma oryzicola]|uniref:redoxin domain-containing protein n=1 Tax=Spirosoma oryzicola TaxID=2898794 RepID=UPI001E3A760E|nr:redoxin domain-containing protein [Spirosoma oryzicola]UHG90478.1 redoxin domain-containing protein [Spirosoma oryzicola]
MHSLTDMGKRTNRLTVLISIHYRLVIGIILLLGATSWQRSTYQRPTNLTVYAFLNTECPISQQYTRRLAELYQTFSPEGVRFVAVFPLRTDTPKAIEQFRVDYKLPFAGQPDKGARLARQFRAHVTPEVVVMQSDGKVRYQGAIDDWYVDLGKRRTEAVHTYLRDALNALLTNQPVPEARTEAVGCLIE